MQHTGPLRGRELLAESPAHDSSYRADIDGLRSLGILPVLFNHVGLRGFNGGYVGVDVFFVISGYLITGILARDIGKGSYSVADFYRRRILRIMPALCVVLCATSLMACHAMLPGELVNYGRSLTATALFASNFLFYAQSGYFDVESHVKPLLHTWSLAIEEQFYIVWPLVLYWIGRGSRARLQLTVLAVVTLSFVAGIVIQALDSSAAFYLLPSRAWELGVGGLLAVVPAAPKPRWIREGLGIGGLLAILLCCWRYGPETDFPGLAALPPCLGAAALILTSNTGTLAGRVLSLPPTVFIGRISYSLYLWHWPVVVFATIWLFRTPDWITISGEIAVSFLLSILTWRLVERPFRSNGRHWSTSAIFAVAGSATVACLGVSVLLDSTSGFAGRFTPAQVALASYSDRDDEASYRRGTCFIVGGGQFDYDDCLRLTGHARPSLLLVGDSHAAHLWPGLERLRNRLDVLQATMVGCRPLLYPGAGGARCEAFFRDILSRWIPQHRPDAILIAGRWQASDLSLLAQTLGALTLAQTRIILVGPAPQYAVALPRLLAFADKNDDPGLPDRFLVPGLKALDEELRSLAKAHGATYISLLETLCGEDGCQHWAARDVPLQFDYGHFSAAGSIAAVGLLEPRIIAAMQR